MKRVNYEDMRLFISSYDRGVFAGQRFGQAFCNHFMISLSIAETQLFYERSRKKAMDTIYKTYITVCEETK